MVKGRADWGMNQQAWAQPSMCLDVDFFLPRIFLCGFCAYLEDLDNLSSLLPPLGSHGTPCSRPWGDSPLNSSESPVLEPNTSISLGDSLGKGPHLYSRRF